MRTILQEHQFKSIAVYLPAEGPAPCRDHVAVSEHLAQAASGLRTAELQSFGTDPNNPCGVRLATLRVELIRLSCGLPARLDCLMWAVGVEVLEHSIQPPPNFPEGSRSDLATEPEAVEVVAGG
jgi:hypothetical protein